MQKKHAKGVTFKGGVFCWIELFKKALLRVKFGRHF